MELTFQREEVKELERVEEKERTHKFVYEIMSDGGK